MMGDHAEEVAKAWRRIHAEWESEKRLDLAFAALDALYVSWGWRDPPGGEAQAVSKSTPRKRYYA